MDNCTEGSMRLVNSTIENEGRIEACRSGNWGPVCGVGEMEAYVVCKALRFDAGLYFTYPLLCVTEEFFCSSAKCIFRI